MPRTLCGFTDNPVGTGAALLIQNGPTLFVHVGFDSTFNPAAGGIPASSRQGLGALVDTGAIYSCIDAQLADELALPIIDQMEIAGSNGRHVVNAHLAQIYVPSLLFVVYGKFAAVDLSGGGQLHQVLLGRTFLEPYTMIYEGQTGTVTIYN